jgi:hypothetical protein
MARCMTAHCSNCHPLRCEKQVSWFVGNQKAVLGITEGSGRVDLDQKDEQRKAKEDKLYGVCTCTASLFVSRGRSWLRGDKMGID